jgi:nucleoside 2-deoxyribosyltransferase
MFYLASPMTDPEASDKEVHKAFYIKRNEQIAQKLESAGIKIYLPQRDTDQKLPPKKIYLKNLEAIKKSDGMIIVLSETRGVYMEAGYAKAHGKKVIGLRVDETRALGRMVRNFLDNIVSSEEELVMVIKGLNNENRRTKR